MSRRFQEFMREVEQEARREGPEAVAELEAFHTHFRLAGELLELRRKSGLTQRQLAARTGVDQAEISRIEAGGSNPTLTTLSVLARALDADLSIRPRRSGAAASQRRSFPARQASGRRSTGSGAVGRVSAPRARRAKGGAGRK